MNEAFAIKNELKGLKEFQKTLQDYVQFTKRQVSEIINAKLYFIALRAMQTTKKADPSDILNKLRAPSKKYPNASLETVLINKQLGNKNKKGLTGKKMAEAIDKFERRSVSRIQFLRSGWLPAIKKLDYWNKRGDIVFVRRFSPKQPTGLKQYGKEKGNVINAKLNTPRTWGRIMNFIGQGKQHSPTVNELLQDGLNKGVAEEVKSMRIYIDRKIREKIEKVNKKRTF